MCNKYDIHVKINRNQTNGCFDLGYVTKKDSIKNWDGYVGNDENRKESVSMRINTPVDEWYLYDKDNDEKSVKLKCKCNALSGGDTVILSFDFINNELIYYVNNKNNMATKISLNHKPSIIPAFSSTTTGYTIEIVNWELH
eukprot:152924_1